MTPFEDVARIDQAFEVSRPSRERDSRVPGSVDEEVVSVERAPEEIGPDAFAVTVAIDELELGPTGDAPP